MSILSHYVEYDMIHIVEKFLSMTSYRVTLLVSMLQGDDHMLKWIKKIFRKQPMQIDITKHEPIENIKIKLLEEIFTIDGSFKTMNVGILAQKLQEAINDKDRNKTIALLEILFDEPHSCETYTGVWELDEIGINAWNIVDIKCRFPQLKMNSLFFVDWKYFKETEELRSNF